MYVLSYIQIHRENTESKAMKKEFIEIKVIAKTNLSQKKKNPLKCRIYVFKLSLWQIH